jgi:hypothetical protein
MKLGGIWTAPDHFAEAFKALEDFIGNASQVRH